MEKGYVLLNRFIGLFTHNYVCLALTVNIILFIPLYKFIKKHVSTEYWGLCVFVFTANPYMFVQSTFNVLRQTCATGIILWGMSLLLDDSKSRKNVFSFLLIILLAAQFHRMAYIYATIPILLNIKWKKNYWYILMNISVFMNFIGMRFVARYIFRILHFNEEYLRAPATTLNNPVYILFVYCVILFIIWHYEAVAAKSPRKKQMIDFYIASLCFLIVALSNDEFYRGYMVLAFCSLPAIPVICDATLIGVGKIRIKHEEFFIRKLYVLYYFFFYIGYIALLAIKHNTSYVPFRFFFN